MAKRQAKPSMALHLRIPVALDADLRRWAEALGITHSEFVRRAVTELVASCEEQGTDEQENL